MFLVTPRQRLATGYSMCHSSRISPNALRRLTCTDTLTVLTDRRNNSSIAHVFRPAPTRTPPSQLCVASLASNRAVYCTICNWMPNRTIRYLKYGARHWTTTGRLEPEATMGGTSLRIRSLKRGRTRKAVNPLMMRRLNGMGEHPPGYWQINFLTWTVLSECAC